MKKLFTLFALAILSLAGANAQVLVDWNLIVSENFSGVAAGTAITTSNTSLDYARAATGAGNGVLEARNSSVLGKAAYMSSDSNSITGIGSYGLDSFSVGKLSFDFNIVNPTSGTNLFFGMGDGSNWSSNSSFNTNEMTMGMSIDGTTLLSRSSSGSGSWNPMITDLVVETKFSLSLVFNNSGKQISYDGGCLLSDGYADVWLDDTLIGTVALTHGMDATAFRIYATNSAYEIANVQLFVPTFPIPEPSTWLLLGIGAASIVVFRRRK